VCFVFFFFFLSLVIWCDIFNVCENFFVAKIERTHDAFTYWAESFAQDETYCFLIPYLVSRLNPNTNEINNIVFLCLFTTSQSIYYNE